MKLVPVLIAGGGPVGMTLACELSRRGIECMLVERNATTTHYPKMDITNARSMELFGGWRWSMRCVLLRCPKTIISMSPG
jgi:2-polyprenyl-6-methoxyphenol hydroxylase-like FAD-dependent oxidoreductase